MANRPLAQPPLNSCYRVQLAPVLYHPDLPDSSTPALDPSPSTLATPMDINEILLPNPMVNNYRPFNPGPIQASQGGEGSLLMKMSQPSHTQINVSSASSQPNQIPLSAISYNDATPPDITLNLSFKGQSNHDNLRPSNRVSQQT